MKVPPPPWATLKAIADAQILAILALAALPLMLAMGHFRQRLADPWGWLGIAFFVLHLAASAVAGLAIYWLARVLRQPAPILWAVPIFFHFFLALLAFAYLNREGRAQLARAGVPVGRVWTRLERDPPAGWVH